MSVEAKTKLLVYLSIIGIILSFFTQKIGMGELYPFFHWKLYSQPAAKDSLYCVQSIVIINEGKAEPFLNNGSRISKEEYFYTGNQLYQDYVEFGNDSLLKIRVTEFGQYISPDADCYRLVKDCYDPIAYSKGNRVHKSELIITTCD